MASLPASPNSHKLRGRHGKDRGDVYPSAYVDPSGLLHLRPLPVQKAVTPVPRLPYITQPSLLVPVVGTTRRTKKKPHSDVDPPKASTGPQLTLTDIRRDRQVGRVFSWAPPKPEEDYTFPQDDSHRFEYVLQLLNDMINVSKALDTPNYTSVGAKWSRTDGTAAASFSTAGATPESLASSSGALAGPAGFNNALDLPLNASAEFDNNVPFTWQNHGSSYGVGDSWNDNIQPVPDNRNPEDWPLSNDPPSFDDGFGQSRDTKNNIFNWHGLDKSHSTSALFPIPTAEQASPDTHGLPGHPADSGENNVEEAPYSPNKRVRRGHTQEVTVNLVKRGRTGRLSTNAKGGPRG